MWPAVQLSRPELRSFCLFHLCYMVDFNACFWQNCGSVEKGAAGSHSLIRNSFSLFCLLFSLPVNLWLSHAHGCVLPLLTFKTIISWGWYWRYLSGHSFCCYEWRFQIENEQRFSIWENVMMLAIVFKRLFFLSMLSYMHKIQHLMCLLPFYHMCNQEIDNNIDHITMLVDIQLRCRSLGQIPTFQK